MDYKPTVSSFKVNKVLSKSTRLSILLFTQMVLAFIVVAWMNNGIFTYSIPYVPNFIRWGLFVAWFGLALTSNKKFAQTFVVHCWPLLLGFC